MATINRIEDGGALEDWSPVKKRHRTLASPVQRAYTRIIVIIRAIIDQAHSLDPQGNKIEGGKLEPWELPPGE